MSEEVLIYPGDWIRRPGDIVPWHSGMYVGQDESGVDMVVHAMKGGFIELAEWADFAIGKQVELYKECPEERRAAAVEHILGLEGQPYDVFVRNCEQVVSEAIEGVARSPTLRGLAGLTIAGVALAWIVSASGDDEA